MPAGGMTLVNPDLTVNPIWWRFFLFLFQSITQVSPIQPVTVGASPFTYTQGQSRGVLVIAGGTVSDIQLTRGSVTIPVTIGSIPVSANDTVKVTYSVAPTINFVPTTFGG